jgi:integrase
MSSVHKHPPRPFWFCAYYVPDGTPKGKRVYKTTKTKNKKEAIRICAAWEKAARLAQSDNLTPERAREILEDGLRDILEARGTAAPKVTIEEYFKAWIKARESVTKPSTFQRYDGIVRKFLGFMGSEAKRNITSLSIETIERYRSELAESVSHSSVNTHLKVLRVALKKAVPRHFTINPASHVENLDTSNRQTRRAFTLEELRKLLENASQEWRTMILVGLYTGLRLGDCAALCWNNLDLSRREYTLTTAKTGKTQINPLAKPLLQHLESLPAGDDPRAPLCPSLHDKPPAWLSNQFFEIMATAGLVQTRVDHSKKKKGRDQRRKLNEIGFHALRHTATSLLKNAGVSDVVARDIIGHESELISRNYTHIETSTKRDAIDKMPDITKL